MRILPTCQGDYDYLVIAFRAEIAGITWNDHWRREGILRRGGPESAVTLIGGAYHELSMRMLVEERRPPLEQWLRFALETFFRAFGAPETVAAARLASRSLRNASAGPFVLEPRQGRNRTWNEDRRHI